MDDLEELEDGSVLVPVDNPEPKAGPFDENLAETLPESKLNEIASELIERIKLDREARARRDKQYEEGLRRTGLGDDAPGGADFEGASDVVHPVLAEACVDFAARAIKELFPPQGPVKSSIIGQAPEDQVERAERKRTYMNWQLTTQMPEYRSELEQLLTQLPLGGSQFQKFWYDDRFNRPVSEFIPIDDILIPYAAKSFYTAQRVTHVQHITRFEYERRVKNGLYRDLQDALMVPAINPDQTASAIANDKIEGKEEDAYNEDGLRDVYETYCWEEVEGDALPYIITTDAYSEKVLAIYRNWKEDDDTQEKLDWMVEWKFIPWRGAYAIGFPQLIGSLSAAATGALRALLDSAHINNLPGLVKLKAGRVVGQSQTVDPTGVTEIEGPAGIDDIRKMLMSIPYPQTSPVLFQLLGWLTDAAKGVVATAEEAIARAGDRTPVGTTQAMVEQGSVIYSAIHARLHESQKKALQILCRINATWLDDKEEIEELGKLVISKQDFAGTLDVIPVSDPAIFSEAQRYAQNQSILQMAQMDVQDPTVPWNKIAIRRRVLKQMRIENVDELLPLPPKPVTADSLSENTAAMQGMQIMAAPQQDHMAHIQGHLAYLSSPLILQNPLVQGPPLSMILAHVEQHIVLFQQQAVQAATQQLMMQARFQGQFLTPDQAIALAFPKVQEIMNAQISPVIQILGTIQQQVQAKMPQPPMPPEVQASIQIAKMDTDRKSAFDQATLKLKEAEQQQRQQTELLDAKLRESQQTFENMLARQQQIMDHQSRQLAVQVDLLNNAADNRQKQMTELLKNRDDNDTKERIELKNTIQDLQKHVMSIQSAPQPQESTPDLTPHLDKLQGVLDQMSKDKVNDALATVMQGLQAAIQGINAPRKVILEKGPDGKAISATSSIQ